jgi:hypothetical protein
MEMSGAEAVFGALNRSGVAYLVVGGLAVNAHGYVRMTMDIDLVIALDPENILKALRALAAEGFRPAVPVTPEQVADPANRKLWREEKDMRVLKLWSDTYRLTPVDIFIYEPFDFDMENARALHLDLGEGLRVPIVSLEALLEMKREAGRPQDLADMDALREVASRGQG